MIFLSLSEKKYVFTAFQDNNICRDVGKIGFTEMLDFMAAQPQHNFPLCIVRASFPITTHPAFCLNTKLQYHGEDQLGALQCPKFPQTEVCATKLTCNSKTQLFSHAIYQNIATNFPTVHLGTVRQNQKLPFGGFTDW